MPTFVVDTNCMIAAVCSWHEHHAAATAEIESRIDREEALAVPAAALVEAYAVLTRLPTPHRLSPADAWHLLQANFVEQASVITLDATTYTRVLSRLAEEKVGGGRTYDAIIAECAQQAGAGTLLTFNDRHFEPAPTNVAIVVPRPS
jgi:predicted nucleic acid-binding protein